MNMTEEKMRNLIITTGSLIFVLTIFFLQFHFNKFMVFQMRKEFASEEAKTVMDILSKENIQDVQVEKIAKEIYEKNLMNGKEKVYGK